MPYQMPFPAFQQCILGVSISGHGSGSGRTRNDPRYKRVNPNPTRVGKRVENLNPDPTRRVAGLTRPDTGSRATVRQRGARAAGADTRQRAQARARGGAAGQRARGSWAAGQLARTRGSGRGRAAGQRGSGRGRAGQRIYLVLHNVTDEEVEQLGADLNALQNRDIRPDVYPIKLHSPKPKDPHLPLPILLMLNHLKALLDLLLNHLKALLDLLLNHPLQQNDLVYRINLWKDDIIFQSGNIEINRGDIDDILTNQYLADNHVDAFAFLLSEKRKILPKEFQNYLYISPLYRHINPDSVRESKLIVQPICFQGHWVLVVGRLKDKVWKLYDSLPNPEHKAICTEVIKQIHEDKAGAFPSDITTWKLQTVRGVPTQSNDYDCGIFVCKYMERVILRQKTDWASLKDWQKYMPKFRAELGYALCLTIKM
ncbi:hypothetical protein IEQ34_011545 [Dendrobium chrysotoxum]|uniref:Ubiquitin-like protease family profile domain-containing protein n=1 Tax=Dendrobium chrysotoxum TaxID=161865 RepID=A0AAV7GQ53_DENCH|nr:hypothetical protein IEQ34_011545 [Dendrobium chrysotoxum]